MSPSADWYVSPDQVPTWLYQAVHFTGAVRVLQDELGPHLGHQRQSSKAGLRQRPPWTSSMSAGGRLDGHHEEGDPRVS